MTQDKKELLFKDLCARLPYGVICDIWDELESESKITERLKMRGLSTFYEHPGFGVRPYLRPMSSMIEKESCEFEERFGFPFEATYNTVTKKTNIHNSIVIDKGYSVELGIDTIALMLDWLNAHHFDYRGLIEKGLALKAPEGMYKTH